MIEVCFLISVICLCVGSVIDSIRLNRIERRLDALEYERRRLRGDEVTA